jgi:FkbM family methyltransferase
MESTFNPSIVMLDPQTVCDSFHADTKYTALVQKLFETKLPCYALGRNEHVKRLSELLSLVAVVDDFVSGTHWNDLPVIQGQAVPSGSVVINCSMSISPLSARHRIATLPRVHALDYADLLRPRGSPLAFPNFVSDARNDLTGNHALHSTIFDRLADNESKETFNRIMAYRLTADPWHMAGFSVRMQEQYFEPFLHIPLNARFVDCGGFDGDTSEIFASRYPHYGKIYIFEPSATNMQKAEVRLAGVRDVAFIALGVSDTCSTLRFNASIGSASAISSGGDSSIEVTTLDLNIPERVDFIKMDLEGWELNALKGAGRHIREDHPILAIATYHHISDFWKIPEFVLSQRDDYNLFLRHYTEGWSETVMYFVPRQV